MQMSLDTTRKLNYYLTKLHMSPGFKWQFHGSTSRAISVVPELLVVIVIVNDESDSCVILAMQRNS